MTADNMSRETLANRYFETLKGALKSMGGRWFDGAFTADSLLKAYAVQVAHSPRSRLSTVQMAALAGYFTETGLTDAQVQKLTGAATTKQNVYSRLGSINGKVSKQAIPGKVFVNTVTGAGMHRCELTKAGEKAAERVIAGWLSSTAPEPEKATSKPRKAAKRPAKPQVAPQPESQPEPEQVTA